MVPLQLQHVTSLRRLAVRDYIVLPAEDGSLPALDQLHLQRVSGFTEEWFPPKLLESLRILTVVELDLPGVKILRSFMIAVSCLTTSASPRLPLISLTSKGIEEPSAFANLGTLVLELGIIGSRDMSLLLYVNLMGIAVQLPSFGRSRFTPSGSTLTMSPVCPPSPSNRAAPPNSNISRSWEVKDDPRFARAWLW